MGDTNQNIQALIDHCKFCFDVVIAFLETKLIEEIPSYPEHLAKFESPLFVTWKQTKTG